MQTLRALFQQSDLVGMNVAGDQHSPVFHLHCSSEALPSRRGAAVEHLHARLQSGGLHCQSRRRVLDVKEALAVGRKLFQIPRGADRDAVGQPGMLPGRHALSKQTGKQLVTIGHQGVDLQHRRRCLVVALQKPPGRFLTEFLRQEVHQHLGVAVSGSQILRLGQPGAEHIPQDAIDQPSGCRICKALGLIHRLVDGGGGRDLIQKVQLIDRQTQNLPHHGL